MTRSGATWSNPSSRTARRFCSRMVSRCIITASRRKRASTSSSSRPKAPAILVRREYMRGRGVPCLFAVHQDASGKARERAMGYARAIGGTSGRHTRNHLRGRNRNRSFRRTVPCCAAASPNCVLAGYETLVEAGYKPEVAYFRVHARTQTDRRSAARRRI